MSFSCPFSTSCDLENYLQSLSAKPINLGAGRDDDEDELNTTQRSMISYKGLDSELKITRSLGSGKMVLQGSISFKQRDILETKVSIKVSSPRSDCHMISWNSTTSPSKDDGGGDDAGNPKHLAATKLQKVYKSFRTRRKLADCAVLVEQSWWKLLDFAELKQNSISFFDHENQESAVSRWSRAKSKAAKVGKGLSKCAKARKLALQHWLEAIDPRHRYGHNLHFYYDKWLESQSRQPFFYWLDIGEGKEVNLSDKCPRSKLQQQCIKYLGPVGTHPVPVCSHFSQ
ncbi:IQ domain-containing protein iqm2 [Dionaea muscipula]